MQTAGANVSAAIPLELVDLFVDKGHSPDDFTEKLHKSAQNLSEGVMLKQRAMHALAQSMRQAGAAAGLMDSPVKTEAVKKE